MRKYCALFLLGLLPNAAMATDATTTMGVSATVLNVCLVSATNMAFGSYDPTSASPTDATSTINVTCTPGTLFNIGLNAGSAVGATVSTRKMLSGANPLGYALYSNSGRSTNWGNSVGSDTVAQTASTILPAAFTVYGRIPAQQSVAAGSYTDTVTITVSY
ncbi:spore coat U domain-containing protein [Sphingobium fuliginis]|jgi:spore coat protein U-like protein|uniref:Sigma-fimbriae tip adhesin n=3 Tax=Sphingomonadaceae TaxID=41297 RepID=A0A292ZHH0_SPHSA|nr:spore coat protein [Sphingobium sp. AM]KYC31051.1 spore coat protein [Sphingobium sp. 22B]OAP30951.1 spore coat protein [Sphingobium sp. 20006FA]QDC35967.1 spore coat protein U domain-containing protein [Sphingobium fuliginis ATCC 27551]QOT71784.1 spore coat U domain-containing protein [Sphingobium fuliginis]